MTVVRLVNSRDKRDRIGASRSAVVSGACVGSSGVFAGRYLRRECPCPSVIGLMRWWASRLL